MAGRDGIKKLNPEFELSFGRIIIEVGLYLVFGHSSSNNYVLDVSSTVKVKSASKPFFKIS